MPKYTMPISTCFAVLAVACAVHAGPQKSSSTVDPTNKASVVPNSVLSAADKHHLLSDKFTIIHKLRDIPVLSPPLSTESFDTMADPGQPFQDTDVVIGKPLPFRRLIFAARSSNYCIVYFEHGGIAYGTEASLYHLAGAKIVLVWHARMRESVPSKTLPSLQSKISKGNYF